jgi:hypothetical protein
MRIDWRVVVLVVVVVGVLGWMAGCVNVEGPAEKESEARAEALGGSNGYVLLRYPDGTLYVVDLETSNASKVAGLEQVQTVRVER